MTPEERSELAALHSLSLLEGEEAAFAAHLEATDKDFAAEVAACSDAAGVIADAVAPVQPSDLLRERVLGLAKSTRPQATSRPWIGWAAAAALAVSAIWLWTERSSISRKADSLANELETLRNENKFAGLKIASLESQLDQFNGTRAVVVWDPYQHEGRIQLTNLPPAEAGKDYQLWIVDPAHKNPISGGLIHRDEHGNASVRFQPVQMIRDATAFAISIEKSGGVEVGEGPIVLLGK